MRTSRKRLGATAVVALLLSTLVVGTAYAATTTASGTDSVSGYSLWSSMSVTDAGSGNYSGVTYTESLGGAIDTIHNRIEMQEWCNFSWSTDYQNTVQYTNVSWVNQTSGTVGYATGFFDCTWEQGIRNWGWGRWVDSPSLDYQRVREACRDVRVGYAC